MENVNAELVVPEYKQLVGQGTSGDFVLQTQGGSEKEGFKNVSSKWINKTLTFEQCLENLEKERSNREDITDCWSNFEFVPDGKKIALKNADGRVFTPTEYALGQLAGWSAIHPSHIIKTLSPEFKPDELDIELLCLTLNHRKERYHFDNKEQERELLFRTYDNSLRAVLTTGYGIIDNRWTLERLNELIPNGRISHQRGDADLLMINVLIPDSIRYDQDSDYGGLFAIQNSEIGNCSFDSRPAIYRAICQNGMIWDKTEGINYRTVHKGNIDLAKLAVQMAENLDKQIKLVPEIMERFLELRSIEFKDVGMENLFASVGERFKLTSGQITDVIGEFIEHESDNRSAFGIVNSITRAGQLYPPIVQKSFDLIGGELVKGNWNSLLATAKAYSESDLIKILGLSA